MNNIFSLIIFTVALAVSPMHSFGQENQPTNTVVNSVRMIHYELRVLAKKFNVYFTIEDIESEKSPLTDRGLGSFVILRGDIADLPSREEFESIENITSAIKLLERLLPNYVVALSPKGLHKNQVMHIIHRDLIAESPINKKVTKYSFVGTFPMLADVMKKEEVFSGITLNSTPYSFGNGAVLFSLDDSTQLKTSEFNGSIRALLTDIGISAKPTTVILWKAMVAKSLISSPRVLLEVFPDGGGSRM